MTKNEDIALPRPVRDSQSEMAEIVLPNDSNVLGALLGGRLMHWIDLAAAMAAHRHSRNYVVTASIDHLDFKVPVHVGDLVILRSSVNRVYRTSMEDLRRSRCRRPPPPGRACRSRNGRAEAPLRGRWTQARNQAPGDGTQGRSALGYAT